MSTSFSYLVPPTSALTEANQAAQNQDRQRKLVADIIREVSKYIKLRNASNKKSITIAYTKDIHRGGKLLYQEAHPSSPPFSFSIGILDFDKISIPKEDQTIVTDMLDSIFTIDFPSKGYTVDTGIAYSNEVYSVQHGEPSTYNPNRRKIVNEFKPIKYYKIGWS